MTQTLKKAKLRHAEYYGLTDTFDKLYAESKAGKTFGHLMETIGSDANILLAYRNIKSNKGSHTADTDGREISHLAAMSEEDFTAYVRAQLANYQPKAVRRVEIPKPNGKMRPLGIPCIADRIVQQCVLQVLEPICEAKFHERSHGFRPFHSAENAVADCHRLMQLSHMHYVVDVDIEGFFDNVNHRKLMQQLWTMGIRDTRLLMVIKAMLKAPIQMPNGEIVRPDKGTPQGGILSPLLANVVLNELDWWIDSQWEGQPDHMERPVKMRVNCNGSPDKSNAYRSLKQTRLKEMRIVRYADDFKIFCRNRSDAERTFEAVKQWLLQRLKLNVSAEKSKVTNLREDYCEFLGFKIKVLPKGKDRNGNTKYVVRSHICDKALTRIEKELRGQLEQIQKPRNNKSLPARIDEYNAMVVGIQNYYAPATMVAEDLSRINWIMQNRIDHCIDLTKPAQWNNVFLQERFGGSKMVRWTAGKPLVPIGYVQHQKPMCKRRDICPYTPEGRAAVHKSLTADMSTVLHLMRHPSADRSVEYNDNRLSLYVAQQGRCAVTGIELLASEVHCHHKVPSSQGGTDRYQNLVILHRDVHILVHATRDDTIARYIGAWNLGSKELEKLNKLRVTAGLKPIEATKLSVCSK